MRRAAVRFLPPWKRPRQIFPSQPNANKRLFLPQRTNESMTHPRRALLPLFFTRSPFLLCLSCQSCTPIAGGLLLLSLLFVQRIRIFFPTQHHPKVQYPHLQSTQSSFTSKLVGMRWQWHSASNPLFACKAAITRLSLLYDGNGKGPPLFMRNQYGPCGPGYVH